MKVTITPTAVDSLERIYQYKCEYSIVYADDFVRKIYDFVIKNLSQFPHLGHSYNPALGLFRLVYSEGFNIYYTLGEQEVFVLFIIDGSISLNQDLAVLSQIFIVPAEAEIWQRSLMVAASDFRGPLA